MLLFQVQLKSNNNLDTFYWIKIQNDFIVKSVKLLLVFDICNEERYLKHNLQEKVI